MRIITIDMNSARNTVLDSALIRQGENLASELQITLSNEFLGYSYYLLLQVDNNAPIISPYLIPNERSVIRYALTSAVTAAAGRLKIEIHAVNGDGALVKFASFSGEVTPSEDNTLIKSAIYSMEIKPSLDGTSAEVMPTDYVPWYNQVIQAVDSANALFGQFSEAEAIRQAGYNAFESDITALETGKADKTYTDTELAKKADKADTYTKTQVDDKDALKADKADTYTKAQVDGKDALKADKTTVEAIESEVTLARGTEPTLGARLDGADAQLAENEQGIVELNDRIKSYVYSENMINPSDFIANYMLLNGIETAYTGYTISDYIPVQSGKTYYVYNPSAVGGTDAFFNSDKVFVRNLSESELKSHAITIPNGVSFIRFSRYSDKIVGFGFYENDINEYRDYQLMLSTNIKVNSSDLNLMPDVNNFVAVDMTNTVELTVGEAWGSNGQPRIASRWTRTNKLPCFPNCTYAILGLTGEVCLYDNNGINGKFTQLPAALNVEQYITIPGDKYYMGFDGVSGGFSNFQLVRISPTEEEKENLGLYSNKLSISTDNLNSKAVKISAPLHEKKIVNLGDSIFGLFNPPYDVSTYLAEYTGATVYNCGFGGTSASTHSRSDFAAFSLWKIADAIATNNYTVQDTAMSTGGSWYPPAFPTRLATLKSIDFSTVDIITIAFGTNDFAYEIAIDNDHDVTTFGGALRYSLEKIWSAYPDVKIVLCTPIFRTWLNGGLVENDSDERTQPNTSVKLTDFVEKVKSIGMEYHTQVVDNYHELGINKFTRSVFFDAGDFTHPNETGRELIAKHIAKELWC